MSDLGSSLFFKPLHTFLLIILLCTATASVPKSYAQRASVPQNRYEPVTILHTNDLHSHFKPDSTHTHNLGGLARIATLSRQIRAANERVLLLDGGDWSEGHSYYNLGGGRTAIEMMNALHYDAAVVGNHDWLNGPDQLLDLLAQTTPQFAMLAANLDLRPFARADELSTRVLPSTIIEKNGLKIGVIGIATYELIYDRYLEPVRITYPFPVARRLARELKQNGGADIVIVISHNSLQTNRLIAALPFVDVVIHSHDHVKLPEPIVVTRDGKNAYIVEAEQWGHYLGEINLLVDRVTKTAALTNYTLHQIDSSIQSDPAINALVHRYDAELNSYYASLGEHNIFSDRIAQSTMRIDSSGGRENLMGNLAADAYRRQTGADVAFEQVMLTSGFIVPGAINSIDLINTLTQIFNPTLNQGWTLWTMQMTGDMLRRIVMLIYVIQDLIPGGLPSVSGLHAVFDPAVADEVEPGDSDSAAGRAIRVLEVGGRPVRPNRLYTVAVTDGILHALEFLEDKLNYHVTRLNVTNTGVETWKALRNHIMHLGIISPQEIPLGNRFQILKPDLAVFPHNVTAVNSQGQSVNPFAQLPRHSTAQNTNIQVSVAVHNYGAVASPPSHLAIGYDHTPDNTVDDPESLRWPQTISIPALQPLSEHVITTTITVPTQLLQRSQHFMISALLNADAAQPGHRNANALDAYSGNDAITVGFRRP